MQHQPRKGGLRRRLKALLYNRLSRSQWGRWAAAVVDVHCQDLIVQEGQWEVEGLSNGKQPATGWRYWRWGGRGFCLGAGKDVDYGALNVYVIVDSKGSPPTTPES